MNPEPKEKRMEKTSTKTAPRIYVACLAAYNSGVLHGAWIDADQNEAEVWKWIADMLKRSPITDAEEYAIHDYEGFGNLRLSEYASVGEVVAKAAFVTEHGALGLAVLEHFSGDLQEAADALEDRYLGQFESLADYVQDMTEETTEIPASLRYYIDWKAMARDAELSGDLFTIETARDEVHVFSGH